MHSTERNLVSNMVFYHVTEYNSMLYKNRMIIGVANQGVFSPEAKCDKSQIMERLDLGGHRN